MRCTVSDSRTATYDRATFFLFLFFFLFFLKRKTSGDQTRSCAIEKRSIWRNGSRGWGGGKSWGSKRKIRGVYESAWKVAETRGSGRGYRSRSLALAASFPFFSLDERTTGWIDDRGSITIAAWTYQRIVDFTRVKMKKKKKYIIYCLHLRIH